MTVSSTSNRVVYSGNSVTTAWPFSFKVAAAADLVVIFTDLTGTDFTLSASQYSAVGFGLDAGGTVTYPLVGSPIATGTKLTIYRNVAVTQPTSISNQSAMWPSVIEAALDRCTYILQRISDTIARSLTISPTDGGTLNPLPNATLRANSFLGFDSLGQPIAALAVGLSSVSTWISVNLLQTTSAAAARTALGAIGAADTIAFTGPNTHAAIETFAVSPLVPTPALGDVTTKAANMAALAAGLAALAVRGEISGWTYQNDVTNPTRDIAFAAGAGADGANAVTITVGALIKRTDVAWVAGTNQGMLDTGAVGNNDYYLFAIATAAGVSDYLMSLSSTAPTMPATYTVKRLIGWLKRVGGNVVAFHTYEIEGGGIEMNWDAPTMDISSAALTTSRLLSSVKVPQNFSTNALIDVAIINGATPVNIRVNCPDQTDVAVPNGPATPAVAMGNIGYISASTFLRAEFRIRTSAIGQIAARASVAVATYYVETQGFTWSRR